MPETQDWAAASQTAVTALVTDITVPSAGGNTVLVAPVAGRSVVIAGYDYCPTFDAGDILALRGQVAVVLTDSVTNAELGACSISPETPTATIRPPLGAVFTAPGSGLNCTNVPVAGVGSQVVRLTVYYYLV